jgi:hypothetical protein
MTSVPPYVPGLPPGIAQEFLNQWHTRNWPTQLPLPPVVNPLPPQGPQAVNNPSPNTDPLQGTWVTSGGSWRFTKDAQGYRFEESSALGITGEGRATYENGNVHVDYNSSFLGHVTCTLTLSESVMSGSINVLGIPAPFYLRRV